MNAAERSARSTGSFPSSETDRLEIRNQLERILAHPQFRNSKRYPALLKHVVERTLEGRADSLKERTIGIEVFGRKPDYDTNLDHAVRTSAGEVRKRLAQYYVESDREGEIRIELPAGSYVPQFRRLPQRENNWALHIAQEPADGSLETPEAVGAIPPKRRLWRIGILPLAVVTVIVAAIAWTRANWSPQSGFEQFWAPVSASANPITLCIGPAVPEDARQTLADSTAPPTVLGIHNRDRVAFFDAVTLSRLTALLAEKGKRFRTLYSPQISLADLRQGPVILIGAFDNDWTLRLTGPLRYRFQQDLVSDILSIRDEQNPNRNDWKVDGRLPYLELTEDYSIVSRVSDPTTGETVIVVAGITKYGTLSAGEFLTGSRLDEVARYAPPDWRRKNVQVVLGTKVVRGSPGPPRILATYFW
ncbi:MAG: hypothetical protein C5B51_07735 [Terriglobia bacterium]|nr:MAG: hypothetical protein C5B51_07735 [Terriglobia bacterium]